jgi:hypothetical protein
VASITWPQIHACGRAGGHIEVNQLTPLMTHEEEDVEDIVVSRLDDQEIGGPDASEVIGEEGSQTWLAAGPGLRQR